MDKNIAIYLAGKIQKAHEAPNERYWSLNDIKTLEESLNPYTLTTLNPAVRSDNLEDQKSVFGRDMTQVYSSDVVFVDARDRRGLGVGAEMMWAKVNNIPVVTLAPKETHYVKSNTALLGVNVKDWVHPFIYSLSDYICEDVQDGAKWILSHIRSPKEIKGKDSIIDAMLYYRDTQFSSDKPMKNSAKSNAFVRDKIEALC